jgi:hypothetical protein
MYQRGKYVAEGGRLLIDDEYMIPIDVLENNSFFSKFRNDAKIKKMSKILN